MEKTTVKFHKLYFEKFSSAVVRFTGSSIAFYLSLATVVVWIIWGKIVGFSDKWEDVFDTTVTVITFLMVFIIQNSQNKDGLSIQLKLNELIASNKNSSNRLVNVEGMTEDELKVLQKYYIKLNETAMKSENFTESHSVEEAEENQQEKLKKK